VTTLEALETRCRKAGLRARLEEGEEGEGEEYFWYRHLILEVPAGEMTRKVVVQDGDLDGVSGSHFEEFCFVDSYDAVWSSTRNLVEASLRGTQWTWENVLRFYGASLDKVPETDRSSQLGARSVVLPSPWPDVSLTIGPASVEHAILCGETLRGARRPGLLAEPLYGTLQVRGGKPASHGDALALLQGVSSSVMFRLERQFGIPLHLAPPPPDIHLSFTWDQPPLPPLDRRYQPEPLELFWYGKTAGPLHLLGFLAYYQVLEYFFPKYSPRGREPEQLLKTLRRGVTAVALRTYITGDSGRSRWFVSPEAAQLYPATIDPAVCDDELCTQARNRIYGVRCRIVHTKSGGGWTSNPPLLPFSAEARLIREDLALVEFCAERIIEATSTQLVRERLH
jgi:hypothetical protein